jgi:hypothetical protein
MVAGTPTISLCFQKTKQMNLLVDDRMSGSEWFEDSILPKQPMHLESRRCERQFMLMEIVMHCEKDLNGMNGI